MLFLKIVLYLYQIINQINRIDKSIFFKIRENDNVDNELNNIFNI